VKTKLPGQRRGPVETRNAPGSLLDKRLGKVVRAENLVLECCRVGRPVDCLLTVGGSDTANGRRRRIAGQQSALERSANAQDQKERKRAGGCHRLVWVV